MIFTSLNLAYQRALIDVLTGFEYQCAPRDQKIREILNYKLVVDGPSDRNPIITADQERNKTIAQYTNAEFELYEKGTRDATEFARASSFWKKLANPDGTINSAYGHLVFDRKICGNPQMELWQEGFEHGRGDGSKVMRSPWEWAKIMLEADRDTRQAIILFNTPDVLWVGNKDVVCTLNAHFLIRDNKLHLSVDMRSCDVVLGLVYDCVWFSSLMHRMLHELRPKYANLQLGTYTHYSHSLHIYERNFEAAAKMIGPLSG
jgi:hypothetical protein